MKKNFHIHIKAHAGFLTKAGKDPYVDWAIILSVSAAAAIVFIYFSVSLFLYTTGPASTMASPADTSSAGGTLDKADLDKLIADFQDKKARTALFQAGYQGAPDPSGAVASTSAPELAPLSPPAAAPSAKHGLVSPEN
jgi:hypothetical protein